MKGIFISKNISDDLRQKGIVKICKKHGVLSMKDVYSYKRKGRIYLDCQQCRDESNEKRLRKFKGGSEEIVSARRNYYNKVYQNNKHVIRERSRIASAIFMENIKKDEDAFKVFKDKVRKRQAKYSKTEKCAIRKRRASAKNIKNIGDSYVRSLLYNKGIKYCDIPAELVELKRVSIMIKRKIKELK